MLAFHTGTGDLLGHSVPEPLAVNDYGLIIESFATTAPLFFILAGPGGEPGTIIVGRQHASSALVPNFVTFNLNSRVHTVELNLTHIVDRFSYKVPVAYVLTCIFEFID